MNREQFERALLIESVAEEARSGIPAIATFVQGLHESNWGQSTLAKKYLNVFGIKANKSWKMEQVTLPTREYINGAYVTVQATWRLYRTLSECIADRTAFLHANQRYRKVLTYVALPNASWVETLRLIKECGWATDPQYVEKMIKLVSAHKLDEKVGIYKDSLKSKTQPVINTAVMNTPQKPHWAQKAVDRLLHNEIIANGDRLDEPMTRGEAFAVADAILRNKGHIYTTNLGKE